MRIIRNFKHECVGLKIRLYIIGTLLEYSQIYLEVWHNTQFMYQNMNYDHLNKYVSVPDMN